jgi:hypothetical protein
MKLIRQKYNYHVSLDTVEEFERIILLDTSVSFVNETHKKISKAIFHLLKLFIRKSTHKKSISDLSSKSSQQKLSPTLFAVLMGPDFSKCLPYFLFAKNKNLYIFDAWPSNQQLIIKYLNHFKIKNVFFTSSQATEIIQKQVSNTTCHWVPEGVLPESYKNFLYKDKTIDVLALGRKYDTYHQQIVGCLERNNKEYLYEKKKGNIIFPTRDGFVEGLAQSKISICVPSSITHPERSGNIEVITQRYLQSMVSKCIILGHAPKELITLFGYNPIVEIDYKNPEGQVLGILENYSDYHSLVEKNYEMVLKNHTWQNRWDSIKQILNTV